MSLRIPKQLQKLFVSLGDTIMPSKTLLAISPLRILAIYEAKKQQNLQLPYILTSNSANKPSFQNPTKKEFVGF